MGRGTSENVTANFIKEQEARVSTLLDEYMVERSFVYNFVSRVVNPQAKTLCEERDFNMFITMNLSSSKLTALAMFNIEIVTKREKTQRRELTPQEIEAFKTITSFSKEVGFTQPNLGAESFMHLISQKSVAPNLNYSTDDQGIRYRNACEEWRNRFLAPTKAIRDVYKGRAIVPRSRRVTYTCLEDLGLRLMNAGVTKLAAYQHFTNVKTEVDSAVAQIIKLLNDQTPLVSFTETLVSYTPENVKETTDALVLD